MVEAVAASKDERPFIIESKDKTSRFIFDAENQCEHNFSTLDWLEEVVMFFGSNVKGRMASFQKLTNTKKKSPVLLSELSMNIYFPIRGLMCKENTWVLYDSVRAYHAIGTQKTKVHFSNGLVYELPVNYRIIASQMKRCDLYNKRIYANKMPNPIKIRY